MSDETNEDISIRAARLADLSAINDLYLKYSAEQEDPTRQVGDNPSLLAWQLKRLRQSLMAEQTYYPFLLERSDQTLVGYCAALIKENSPGFKVQVYADISELYVTEADNKRELIQRLVETVIQFLDNRGIDKVTSTLSDDLLESALTSMGFAIVSKVMYRDPNADSESEVAIDSEETS